MSSRLEPAALLVAPAVLVAARLAGIDALAVWCAFAVCVMLPGWGAMRLLRVERGLGLSGAAVVSTSLSGIVVPFVCGVALAYALPVDLLPSPGKQLVTALFLGLNLIYIYSTPLEQMKGVVAVGSLAASNLFGPQVAGAFSLLMAISIMSPVVTPRCFA